MTNFEKWYDKIQELLPVSDKMCFAMESIRLMVHNGYSLDKECFLCPHMREDEVECPACQNRMLKWLYEDSNKLNFDNMKSGTIFSCRNKHKTYRETFEFVHKHSDVLWLIKHYEDDDTEDCLLAVKDVNRRFAEFMTESEGDE